MIRRAMFFIVLAAGLAPAAGADSVSLPAVRDNTLFQDANGALSDGAGPVFFAGESGQNLARRALVRFDIAGRVPPGARIDSVTLTLQVSNAPSTIVRTFTLHRVLRDWGEGSSSTTSGSGAPATDGDATWLHTFYPGSLWTSAGGDFDPAASASLGVGDVGSYTWRDQGMTTDVRAWNGDPSANFGWLIHGDETLLNTARRFESRESATIGSRPTLTVHFTPEGVAVGAESLVPGVRLGPCWPNPASGTVRIPFTLPTRADTRVSIVDIAGRQVAIPIDGRLDSGAHVAVWDGRTVIGEIAPAGVYVIRLVVDGGIAATREMVRLR
jgi:hypothetical protein